MNSRKLRESASVRVRDAADPPSVQPLWRLPKAGANDARADLLDQGVMSVKLAGHAPKYQRKVYISRGHSLIGSHDAVRHILAVQNDPAFGERLKRLIEDAGYKSARKFALEGLGWPADNGAQRLNNYLRGRIPNIEIAALMAGKLGVTVMALYGLDDTHSEPDAALADILRHLLALEGIAPERADTIASASISAQRLLGVLPDDDPLPVRLKYATHAAWHQRPHPEPRT